MRPDRRRRLLAPAVAADEDQTVWLITFSDLVLQLFAFVLVMSALGRARSAAIRPVAPAPATRIHRRHHHLRPPVPQVVQEVPVPAAAPAAVPPPVQPTALAAAGHDLEQFVAHAGQADAVSVAASEGEVVLTLGEAISFPSGSDDLQPGARPVLGEVSRLASTMPDVAIHVVGHTDDVPIHTPAFPSNLELSLARAARVARELVGADPSLRTRTFAEGYGAQRPVAPNGDAADRARNRRVEIRLVRERP